MSINRLIWIDALRGFLIIFVVLGHSLQFGDFENRISWNIIYSFHMAAFFMISGYCGYKEIFKLSSLKQKAQQLLLPFITWSALAVLIKGYKCNYLYEIILKPDSSYWFIFVLFFIIALFILACTKFDNQVCRSIELRDIILLLIILLLISIMVFTEFRLFGFQFFALYFGFYVYGYWIRKFHVKFKIIWIVSLGILWFILALFWKMHEVPAPLANISFIPASLITYTYRYVTAFIGALFFMGFAMNFMNNRNNISIKFLCKLGQISLGIYIIHIFIGQYVSYIFTIIFNSNVSIPFILSDFTTRLFLSIGVVGIIQRIPVVRLFLLGKK